MAVSAAAGVTFFIIKATRDKPPAVGSIRVDSVPAGAEVTFDGTRLAGVTPMTIDHVPVGTRHEVKVARYYLSRGAWLAAANRAQGAIVRFPGSPVQSDALEIMVEAYDRMGMAALRDDARKVLAQNFPAERMAKAGQNRVKPWYQFWGD